MREFGGDVIEHYSSHSKFELSEFRKSITDWERLRYFEST